MEQLYYHGRPRVRGSGTEWKLQYETSLYHRSDQCTPLARVTSTQLFIPIWALDVMYPSQEVVRLSQQQRGVPQRGIYLAQTSADYDHYRALASVPKGHNRAVRMVLNALNGA